LRSEMKHDRVSVEYRIMPCLTPTMPTRAG
jgi:hypothetical protein